MKRLVIGVAVAITAGSVAVPGAQAATTRDLYMVKDVEQVSAGVYVGDFAALRKTGKRVVGAVGAFGSEYVCVRGTVKDGKLRAAYYEQGEVAGRFSRTWVGRGDRQRIKAMTAASAADVRTYLGSDPRRFINDCMAQTS